SASAAPRNRPTTSSSRARRRARGAETETPDHRRRALPGPVRTAWPPAPAPGRDGRSRAFFQQCEEESVVVARRGGGRQQRRNRLRRRVVEARLQGQPQCVALLPEEAGDY